MDKDNLALVALDKFYKDRSLRLGRMDGPLVRVIGVSLNPDGSGLVDARIVGGDGNECVVPMASLFDDTSPH